MLAIEELGYQPNLLARSLVNRTSNTLGIVASGLEFYGPSRTLVGIEQEANALGYTLLLDLLHSPVMPDADSVLDDLAARRVDGIIWAVHEIGDNHAWLSETRLRTLPPMIFLTMEARPGASVVSTDNRMGGALATRHLLELGRRVIGIITGPKQWWEARERLAGWRTALLEAGREPAADLIEEGDWWAASGEACLQKLLARRPDLDAVFACNDQMALGVLRCCHARGLRVPEDLAVVGFDSTPESAYFWPSLTTVRQRLAQLGHIAVAELHRMIKAREQGEETAPTIRNLQPSLIVRESTAPVDTSST